MLDGMMCIADCLVSFVFDQQASGRYYEIFLTWNLGLVPPTILRFESDGFLKFFNSEWAPSTGHPPKGLLYHPYLLWVLYDLPEYTLVGLDETYRQVLQCLPNDRV